MRHIDAVTDRPRGANGHIEAFAWRTEGRPRRPRSSSSGAPRKSHAPGPTCPPSSRHCSASRRGSRGGVGLGVGGNSAHVPLRGGPAPLTPFGPNERFGFFGIEAEVDGSRRNPVVFAVNLVPALSPIHLPFRLALGIPWTVGAPGNQPSLGIFLRAFFESANELRYGEGQPR